MARPGPGESQGPTDPARVPQPGSGPPRTLQKPHWAVLRFRAPVGPGSSAFPDPWQTALMGVGHRLSQEGTFMGHLFWAKMGRHRCRRSGVRALLDPKLDRGPPRSTGSLARLALTHSRVQHDAHFLSERRRRVGYRRPCAGGSGRCK